MIIDKRADTFVTVRSALSLPLAPLQYLVNLPFSIWTQLSETFKTHAHLLNENQNLKSEQLLINLQLQRLMAIEKENGYLKSLLHSSHQFKGKVLIAELLAVDSEPFINQVTLNKGLRDGVFVGQPVLDDKGLMGQVIQVGPITSRVLLINDPTSGVSVQNLRNGMRAILVGDGYTGKLKLRFISKTADVKVNDVFLTSGLGDHYPEGFPVGKVVSIKNNPAQQFTDVYLQPSAHLESSRQVLLIWTQKNV